MLTCPERGDDDGVLADVDDAVPASKDIEKAFVAMHSIARTVTEAQLDAVRECLIMHFVGTHERHIYRTCEIRGGNRLR
jgi:hypothetical protein